MLAALGIDWRSGRPAITCPYPRHADGSPSWRWDPGAACILLVYREIRFNFRRGDEPQRRSSFDDAKLHVAQILGREDLTQGRKPRQISGDGCRQPALASSRQSR